MNIPEPIMDPATIMVASSRLRLGLKWGESDICNWSLSAVKIVLQKNPGIASGTSR
jgi:hypothetical protein